MAFSTSSSSLSAAPNVTPLIDVLLVLLIIFMVIVPVAPHGLESLIPTPADSAKPQASLPPLTIQVLPGTNGEHLAYMLNGQKRSAAELRNNLRLSSAGSSFRPVFVKGDPRVDYGAVAAVVAEATSAGYSTIGLLQGSGQ
jgi:biopolymer transport protein TolR